MTFIKIYEESPGQSRKSQRSGSDRYDQFNLIFPIAPHSPMGWGGCHKHQAQSNIMSLSRAKQLEQYTLAHPQEVVLVTVETLEGPDQILIFRGFSSSLMRPTAFDPEVLILSDVATILSIDLLTSPYHPENPHYRQKGLTWEQMEVILRELN